MGRVIGLAVVVCSVLSGAASAQDVQPTASLSFEEPVYVNMPVWAVVVLPPNPENAYFDMMRDYPFSGVPWDFMAHGFEVVKDGQPLPKLEPTRLGGGGVYHGGYSTEELTKPVRRRLPLHLHYRFAEAGTYMVRYHAHNPVRPPRGPLEVLSEWRALDVKPFSDAQRRAWLEDRNANPPTDPKALLAEYLPSILACPDAVVLDILRRYTAHSDNQVQLFALYGIDYLDKEAFVNEMLRLVKEKGATESLALIISWRRADLSPVGEQLMASLIPFLMSTSAVQVGGSLRALGFMKAYFSEDKPQVIEQMDQAVWDAVPHVLTFTQREALQPLALYMGGVKSDRSREVLWQLSAVPCVRGQALICLGWVADPRDLPKLGEVLLTGDPSGSSVTYQLRRQYGAASFPYLLKGLQESPNVVIQWECAQELSQEGYPEAFEFIKKALETNKSERMYVVQFLHDHFGVKWEATNEEIVKLLDAKIQEAKGKRQQ